MINLDQEISRRSIRQSTPTPPTTASRPPSGRSHTPTRQTNPASNATTNSQAPKLNKKANNSQLKKVVPEDKPKRNSSPINSSGSSIVQNMASNTASTASAANNEAKKGMKTRSAKSASATASAVGRSW